MQDILIPATKRISYFFGWDDRNLKPKEVKRPTVQPTNFFNDMKFSLLNSLWLLAKNIQHLVSWIGVKTVGHGLSLGHDFDILCYVFDKDHTLIEIVAPGIMKDINESGSIYHSGEDETGEYGPFDEELSMELGKIPETSHSIIVYIRNDSDHDATPHAHAKIRLMNMTDHAEYFTHNISFDGHNEHGYIVGRLRRLGTTWRHDFIDEYSFAHPDGKENDFFHKYLAK